jgi:hypothetical protein
MGKKYLPKPAEAAGADIPRRVLSSPPLEIHLSRSADRFECTQLKEPELLFGENHRCVDPRTGLAAYGPYCNAGGVGRGQLRVGIIGTEEAIEKTLSLLQEISGPVEQDPSLDSIHYPSFPGLNSGKPFSVDVITQPSWHRSASPQALRLAEDCGDSIAKFGMLRELFGAQVHAMSILEFPPNVVICAAPACLERSLLNAACAQSLPIEIVSNGNWQQADDVQKDKATEAWNLSVRLLYNAGLTPWRLADAAADSCFVGIYFFREPEITPSNTWTCFAHIVTDLGQGFVLRGDTFEWSVNKGPEETPHLAKDQAAKLMSRILQAYEKNVGRSPRKVVVHKTSPYTEAERLSFADPLRGIKQHALVSVSKRGTFFLRPGRKPVFRGAAIPLGEKLGLVYLSGYTPFLRCYPGKRMPQPFEITENWGSLTFQEAARDLLRLTKLNWSTSNFCAEVPATLDFSSRAREIFKILGQQDLVLEDRFYL